MGPPEDPRGDSRHQRRRRDTEGESICARRRGEKVREAAEGEKREGGRERARAEGDSVGGGSAVEHAPMFAGR